MGRVNVVIVDATGNKEQKVGLPDDIKCGIIMVKLVEKIKLPSVGPDGNPISYKFIHKVTGRQLLETQTLGEAGVRDGDVLRLQPEITAGAVCGRCGNSEQDGSAFCSKCGASLSAPPAGYAPPQPQPQPQPAYTPPAYPPVRKSASDKSGLVLALGIIGAALFVLSNLVLNLGDISYGAGLYRFLYFLSSAGQGIFLLAVTFYMYFKMRKQG